MNESINGADAGITEFVTAMIGGQLFGLPISRVQDVFMPDRLTRVPLASDDVAGVLNLRGRIVTADRHACAARLAQARQWPAADGGGCRHARRDPVGF